MRQAFSQPAETHPVLTVSEGSFLRAGQPHQIISGALHYFRVHPDLWEDRLRRVQAMGLNTVETYVAWNFHERRPGQVDFTGWRDVSRFIELAGGLGLDVIVRPGPYICAEWDFGGLPAWLMAEEQMDLRSSDPRYLKHVDAWFDDIVPILAPLQATHGGPVVAVQVENEYGSFGDDAAYLAHCSNGLTERGIDVLLFTSDGPGPDYLSSGTIPGVLATVNFGSRVQESFAELRKVQPAGPDMCMEFWNGWFDHWGQEHHERDPQDAARVLAEMLRGGASVNFYMAHGGTNFGLWNGANIVGGQLRPTVTSYDYDAAVSESGELTAKFHAFRDVIERHTGQTPPDPPAPVPAQRPSTSAVHEWVSLWDVLDAFDPPRRAAAPMTMEQLGQDHGLVLYRGSALVPPDGRHLVLDGLADRALVFADHERLAVLNRNDPAPHRVPLAPRQDGNPTQLDVLVENQGRVNFADAIGERKGVRSVRIDQRFIHQWESIAIRLDDPDLMRRIRFVPAADAFPSGLPEHRAPLFARATVELEDAADGFIELLGWTKGFVWLNGTLLGRYWGIGPQLTLYAPRPLWRTGLNDIVILELERPGRDIHVRDSPVLGASATPPGVQPAPPLTAHPQPLPDPGAALIP